MSLFTRLFSKHPSKFMLDFDPKNSYWRIVSWNFDLGKPKTRKWSLEIHTPDAKWNYEWQRDGSDDFRIFENGSLKSHAHIKSQDGLKEMMNLAMHSTLKFATESHHSFLLTPFPGATSMDYQNENRAQAWIEATCGTLTRALEQFKQRPDLILTAAVFSGNEPKSGLEVLRLVAFNLDIFLYMQPDASMDVIVYDDKGQGHGASAKPVFQQNIKVTKPQIYDEILKLVHRIATVGEIK